MRNIPLIISLALVCSGCATDRCKDGTALVSFTLRNGAEAATSFDLTLTIAGTTFSTSIVRKTQLASGSIEVDFAQYPSSQPIVVGLVARAENQVLASSTLALTTTPGCTALSLTLDGSALDLAPNDLSADLRCSNTTEDCFNGVDDDCNGLVDCADPQCGGTGECVPDPGSALSGTLGSPCPTSFPSPTPLFATMSEGSCNAGSCACGSGFNGTPTCSATLTQSNSACLTNTGTVFSATDTSGCLSFSALSSSANYDLVTPAFSGSCNAPSGGTPIKVAPTWSVSNAFCAGSRIGGGCAGGQICVPVAANHCVLEPGDQAACTVSGYSVKNTTQFFTGFDDSTRACSCACTVNGICNSAVGFGNGGCGGALTAQGAGCYNSWPAYDHAQVSPPSGANCSADATSSGTTSTSGFERTVCCTK